MRARAIALTALLGIGLALNGCALIMPSSAAPDANRLGPGRRLILARITAEENRANSEAAAGLLLNALRDAGHMVGTRELLAEARGVGLEVWAAPMLGRLQRSGWPTPDDGRMLLEQFGITMLVITDLTSYEQVWGKYGKFTRVGLEAQAYDLRGERVVWRLGKDAEVEEMRGRAFQYAMEQAVQDLADAIYPRTTFSVINAWRYWRR
jgi:hypothetical protein